MSGNRAWALVAILLVVLIALWLLKVAIKLVFVGLIVVAGIAVFQAVRGRIGGR